MNKLYDLLNSIVVKLNQSIKTEKQTLSEAQKKQARDNIGAVGTEDLPEKLPNPETLTINGKVYDGSESVDITITGGGASENILLGQTPITLTDAATVRLVGEGEHTYTVKGVTVADLSTATVTKKNVEITDNGEYIELAVAGSPGNWFDAYATIGVKGLVAGTKYVLAVVKTEGVSLDNKLPSLYALVKNSKGTTIATLTGDSPGLATIEFAADTTDIEIWWYITSNYYWSNGCRSIKINDLYINEAADGTERTKVINKSGEFTDSYSLGALSKGTKITCEPSCEVYSVSGGGGSGGAALPLEGKTVVCFGDSLFGMYTGDTSAPAYVAKSTGATVYNVGFGGCRMSVHPYTGYNEFCMYALADAIASGDWSAQDSAAASGSANFPEQLAILKRIDFETVDAIVIHYGTNDFAAGAGVAIDNTSNPKDVNTLCGALRYSVEKLLSAYPKLDIYVSLPAFRFWQAEDGTITYSDEKKNVNGYTLPDFVKALAETAKEYKFPVIDCYYGLGINKNNATTFLADGVHHNAEGRKRFGEYIGSKLVSKGDTSISANAENGGGSGGSSSADWNVNDPSADGYIKNRPFYSEYAPTVLLDNADFPNGASDPFPLELVAGQMYHVVIDEYDIGTHYEYDCEAQAVDLGGSVMVGIGNLADMGFDDTGEIFFCASVAGIGQFMNINNLNACTVTLTTVGEVVHKIPEKYLDDNTPFGIVVSEYDDGSVEFVALASVADVEEALAAGREVYVELSKVDFADSIITMRLVTETVAEYGKQLGFAAVAPGINYIVILTPTEDGSYSVMFMDSGDSSVTLGIAPAAVGQIPRIKAVNGDGEPTAWEAVDMPSGGSTMRKIADITLSEIATGIVVSTDIDGKAINLKAAKIIFAPAFCDSSGVSVEGRARLSVSGTIYSGYMLSGDNYVVAANSTPYFIYEVSVESDNYITSTLHGTNDNSHRTYCYQKTKAQTITDIQVVSNNTSTVKLNAGTVLEIWGEDA
jgi:lysophospholipase L1-like esterase